ncbi:MAG TPA: SMC-Scp complex subunit ScpB [Acidobacteriota bacterium]|nr:SMC-Scp complex subunit ScpB [Acidobacteriota bacterium]
MLEIHNQILSILFASRDPVSIAELQEVFPEREATEIREAMEVLREDFNQMQAAVELRQVAGGFRITTLPEHHETIREYLKNKPSAKLTMAALETLAVVAYKQPITIPEISEIRGVKGSSTIKTLLEKKLIETRGRKKTAGRPMQYATTREFLIHFGLNDLSELPTLKELEEILSQDDDESLEPPEEDQDIDDAS